MEVRQSQPEPRLGAMIAALRQGATMPFATNARDGSRVYFEDDGGGGSPTVILGGFLDPVELVRGAPIARALQELSEEFRLIYVDHRGHGRSDKPHEAKAYAMPLRVADVAAVLDGLGIERAHFLGISWGGRLCFGIGEYAPERVRSLVIIGQQPYAIDPDGPLARVVGEALEASRVQGIEALVEAFEVIAGRYPESVRATYLGGDAAAMRAAWSAVVSEGAVSDDLGGWDVRCLVCVAVDDVDFFDQARRAAEEIPDAVFAPIDGEDHLGMDTAEVDPILPAVLRTLRETS
jgi:pimeloyl-ACP methyl ester carboxylesterase